MQLHRGAGVTNDHEGGKVGAETGSAQGIEGQGIEGHGIEGRGIEGQGIEGWSALVTGGGSGIGLGTAARLVRDGAHVTICGRTEGRLRSAVTVLEETATTSGRSGSTGGTAGYVVADVTVEEQVAHAVEVAASERGRLDILFANAGGAMHMGPIVDADVDQVRSTVDLNLIGTFLCIKHGAPMMAEGKGTGVDGGAAPGGSIIGMSSGAGAFTHRYLWAYGSAKAAIDMLCRYAAEELGPTGVRVNTVQPGIVDDELMAPITAGGPLLDDYLAQMPISRLGTVEDIAAAGRFLAGPESGWISGESLAIDGGHHLRRGANYGLLFGE
jgi:NAD(P)-dependent dehydrogenase (short-subunit alcohol dehydrogenase family)